MTLAIGLRFRAYPANMGGGMNHSRQKHYGVKSKPWRKQFADGSAIVTCPDGTRAILESSLAKPAALHQEKPVSYRVRYSHR